MFHQIPNEVQERMKYLEAVDARDRVDGTPHRERLRQIPPETGRYIAMMAASAQPGQVLEIGASAGYSSMWLALACRQRGDRLVTFELLEDKARLAEETFAAAGLADEITLVCGDALHHLPDYHETAFCFLDAEKDVYQDCYDLVVPNLVDGGMLIADNMISHADDLQPFLDTAQADPRLDAVVVPVGKGLLFCRKGTN
ncbi:MAG: O-methyltransferase [Anaerolineales bacterium]|nr:O-methyltransferase [Anaerolineales bacterium]